MSGRLSFRRALFAQLRRNYPLPLDKPAGTCQFDPWQFLGTGRGDRRYAEAVIRETAGCNADQMRSHRRVPAQRSPARAAKVTLLVVIVRVMKRVDGNLASDLGHVGSTEVGRYTEGAAGAAFAVCAMTNSVKSRLTIDRNGCRATGALRNA